MSRKYSKDEIKAAVIGWKTNHSVGFGERMADILIQQLPVGFIQIEEEVSNEKE